MNKFNNIILWIGSITPFLVVAGIKLPPRFVNVSDDSNAAEIITAVSLLGSYTLLVACIIAVGASTYGNLNLRREDPSLQTRANRWYFNAGFAYCIAGIAFILFPVL